jgi:hypothetical protein
VYCLHFGLSFFGYVKKAENTLKILPQMLIHIF